MNYNDVQDPEQTFPKAGDAKWKMDINRYSTVESLTISHDALRDYIREKETHHTVLVVSIFGKESQPLNVHFTLEITQTERVLREGLRQVGFLEEGEIVQYELYPSSSSILTVHALSGKECL